MFSVYSPFQGSIQPSPPVNKHCPRTKREGILDGICGESFPLKTTTEQKTNRKKNKIKIFGKITIPETCLIDTGFAPKLFSMLSVEIDSQLVKTIDHATNSFLRIIFTKYNYTVYYTVYSI